MANSRFCTAEAEACAGSRLCMLQVSNRENPINRLIATGQRAMLAWLMLASVNNGNVVSSPPFLSARQTCQSLFLPEGSADRIPQTSAVLPLLQVNKPASELPSQSLLIIVNGTAREREPTGLFFFFTCTASALRWWLNKQTVSWH